MGALFFLLRRCIPDVTTAHPLVCPPRLFGVDPGDGGRLWHW
jgi:hypothetical protein